MTSLADVHLWGRRIGAVALEPGESVARFAYVPDFIGSGIEVAPLTMPLAPTVYRFPGLNRDSFHGLPGLLADALPDRYGHALIDAWLATQGRAPGSFNAVERLCYIGARGMGALEFHPTVGPEAATSAPLRIEALVELASEVLRDRDGLRASFADPDRQAAMRDILRVGTSAGGARAKAVIAWNPATGEVRSGQLPPAAGFEHWLMKFDGVTGNRDKELADPQGYGVVEYVYSQMAALAGIEMSECRLFEEGGRRHFMTRRFDRTASGGKLHMQSLAAIAHLDFNAAGAHSYEQALFTMRRLGLPMADLEALFRRMLFNIVARNQDDHVKNIAFLMDRAGRWRLAPAFDLTWAWNPEGAWTARHQMSVNGRRDDFTRADIEACADTAGLARHRARTMLDEVLAAVAQWPRLAAEAGIEAGWRTGIAASHRLRIPA